MRVPLRILYLDLIQLDVQELIDGFQNSLCQTLVRYLQTEKNEGSAPRYRDHSLALLSLFDPCDKISERRFGEQGTYVSVLKAENINCASAAVLYQY